MNLNLYKIVDTKPIDQGEEFEILEALNTMPTLKYGTFPLLVLVAERINKSYLKQRNIRIMQGGCKGIIKDSKGISTRTGYFCSDANNKYIAS